jgi:cobalamin biosynthesis protein CobD/CbiB
MAMPTTLADPVSRIGRSAVLLRRHWIRRLNLALAVAWAAMIPVSILTGWLYSIAFIAAASIYANFVSHLTAWRADVPNHPEDA